jgi:hypothetical protein
MNTSHPLTKDDIAAIRQADRLYAHVRPGENSTITAVKTLYPQDRERKGPFTTNERERQREIATDSRQTTDCPNTMRAFFSVPCGQFGDGNMGVLALMLRPGDRLVLSARTNENGYVRAASIQRGRLEHSPSDAYDRIYVDELTAEIVRVKDEREHTIARNVVIAMSICPDNSARAIRAGSY